MQDLNTPTVCSQRCSYTMKTSKQNPFRASLGFALCAVILSLMTWRAHSATQVFFVTNPAVSVAEDSAILIPLTGQITTSCPGGPPEPTVYSITTGSAHGTLSEIIFSTTPP